MKILLGTLVIDRPKTTEKCIKQILKNTDRSKFTWIVIDNNSNEETKDVLEKYKQDIDLIIHNPFNVGTSFGVNQYMVYREMGQHVLNVNCDAHILNDDWLDIMFYIMEHLPELGTVSGRRPTFWYDTEERWNIYRQQVNIHVINKDYFVEHPQNNCIIFPWTMILSRTIEQIGYINEATCIDDIDYISRISAIKLKNIYIPDVVILQPQDEEQHHPEYNANRELILSKLPERDKDLELYKLGLNLYCGTRFSLIDKGDEEYQKKSDENWEWFRTYKERN